MTGGSHGLWAARPTCRRLTAWSNHHKLFPWATPAAAGFGLGETSRAHSVLLARLSRPFCWFTTGLPEIILLGRPEDARGVKGHIVFHHMPRGLGQFAGQRLGRDDRIGLLFLAVVEAAALIVITAGEVRGFHEGPGQIFVAAFAVVLALLLAVARAQAFHAAAVAGEVPGVGEALGVAGFQRDGQTENLADAGQFLQALVGGPFPDDAQDVLLQLHDRVGEVSHQGDLLPAQELVGGVGEAGLGFLGLHSFDAGQRHTLAEGALVQALEAQDQCGALADQKQPAAQQIAHGAGLAVVEMAGGQEVQAQELGEKVGVRNVVGVFHSAVGLHPGRIGEHDVIAVILKTVHQPIPIVGGLDGDGGDALLVRLEQLQDGSQVAGELLVDEAAAAFVHQAAEGVVAVQVNSDHNLHSGFPVG